MSFIPGYNSRYFAGSTRLSAQGRSFAASGSVAQLEVPSEGRAKAYINGPKDGDCTIDMALDTAYATPSQIVELLSWRSALIPVTFGQSGCAAGDLVWMFDAIDSSVNVKSDKGSTVDVSVSCKPSGGVDFGYVVDAETAITADTNGTSLDSGAGTTNGGVAHLHVTAYTGLTSNAIILEHSTNNSVWATLGSFASVTGTGYERLVIAPGTTVNRYLRISDDVTGTGSCTRMVAFARR